MNVVNIAQPKEKESEMELLTRDNQQLQLLGQGAYGCAFYPEINCKTHHIDAQSRGAFLSKIQYADESLDREMFVGKLIVQKLPQTYRNHFAPIVESCPVALSQLKQNKIRQCDVLTRYATKKQNIVSSKIPFVGKQTMIKYFDALFKPEACQNQCKTGQCDSCKTAATKVYLKQVLGTYRYLISSFDKLDRVVGAVHLDVKNDNIIYDEKNAVPIVIDFGMSYPIAPLMLPEYLKFPYPFGIQSFSYAPWCIEVSLMARVARDLKRANRSKNQHGGYLDEALLKSVVPPTLVSVYQSECANFVKNIFTKYSSSFISPTEMADFTNQLQQWIATLAQNKTFESLWTALVNTHSTWDLYSLAMTYLRELHNNDVGRDLLVNQLKSVVLAVPGQRPSAQQMSLAVKAIQKKIKQNKNALVIKRNPPQAAQDALLLQER